MHEVHAMPLMIAALCAMAIAYRYYSAFLAAKVAVLDDQRTTPAITRDDGVNYHPTNKWVLFGHHFAAISGAGPLIGPVLAAQFGYMPGLLWIVIGVCLAGAVQDFLVLAASVRRGGRSLAQIAFTDIGKIAGTAAMIAILFILVIAMAGLGKVVVRALGGDSVAFPANTLLSVPGKYAEPFPSPTIAKTGGYEYRVPSHAEIIWNDGKSKQPFDESFTLWSPSPLQFKQLWTQVDASLPDGTPLAVIPINVEQTATLPAKSVRVIPGSSWGIFTIACTIPIALFVGFYIYRLRKGKVIEASIIGGVLTLAATFAGGWIASHPIGQSLNLTGNQVLTAMAIYGFIAAVLPVWVLLVPRDYLSSFLKIGTIAVLVIGVIGANPVMHAPAVNHVFMGGGPTVGGKIFPFLFITIMCGAISGFHSLVSSGTTSKMLRRESDARMIGYGAMMMEGLVGVVALIAASTLSVGDYYALNTEMVAMPKYHDAVLHIPGGEIEHIGDYEHLTQESLRGRTGGGVTLAVGMAAVLGGIVKGADWLWKYWYHFAIMFEALFILTTIDAGTRIGRFLLQEMMGRAIHPKLGETTFWPGTLISTAAIVSAWAYLLNAGDFNAIWAMFGVANQMLAVIALAIVSVYLVNEGKERYIWVTVLPLLLVMTTTSTAAVEIFSLKMDTIHQQLTQTTRDAALLRSSIITAALLAAMVSCTIVILATAAWKIAMRNVNHSSADVLIKAAGMPPQ